MYQSSAPHYHHRSSLCCPVRHLDKNGLSGSIPTSLGSCGLLTHLYVHLRHVMHKQDLVSQVATMGLQQIVHPKHEYISAVQHTHHAHSPHTYSLTHTHQLAYTNAHTHARTRKLQHTLHPKHACIIAVHHTITIAAPRAVTSGPYTAIVSAAAFLRV